jgi:hypothetical protein
MSEPEINTRLKALKKSNVNFMYNETIDFSKNRKLALAVNLLGILSFPVFYIIIFYLLKILTGSAANDLLYYWKSFGRHSLIYSAVFIIALLFLLVLHEFIHAVLFYLFTGEKPVYGFKGIYGYAGSPDWYLKKSYYLIVGLSPFILISVSGLIIQLLIPSVYSSIIVILLTTHAAGCIGDIWVSIKLIGKPEETYINDSGISLVVSYNNKRR